MENYILEAFQKLSLLKEDDFDITADRDVVDELQSFVADDVEEIPEEPVIDLDAESEDELADNYVGKVILECECCHTRIYKEESEVFVDEESGLANIEEECPVCNNTMGYTVIGKIEKFDEEPVDDDDEDEEEIELENDPMEDEEEESPIESLRMKIQKRRESLSESKEEEPDPWGGHEDKCESKEDVCPECGKNPCVCEKCEEGSLEEEVSLDEKTKVSGGANIFQKIKDVLASTKTIFKLAKKAVQDGDYSDADVILKELNRASKEVSAMLKADIPLTNEKFQKAYKEMVCFTAMMILYIFHNGDVEGLPDPDDIFDAYTMRVEGDTIYDDFGAYNEDIKIAAAGLGFSKKIFNIEESLEEDASTDSYAQKVYDAVKTIYNIWNEQEDGSLEISEIKSLPGGVKEIVVSGSGNYGAYYDEHFFVYPNKTIGCETSADSSGLLYWDSIEDMLDEFGVSSGEVPHDDATDIEYDESLKEGIENLSLDTDDTHVEMNSTEDGGATVSVEPKMADVEFPGDDIPADLSGDEEIVPLSDEEEEEILANEPEGEEDEFELEGEPLEEPEFEEEGEEEFEDEEEDEEELPEESLKTEGEPVNEDFDEFADMSEGMDINEFDESKFNDLCESYLRKVYENVNTFITESVKDTGDNIIVEGIIKFKNDKQMKSRFVFTEANETKSGKIVLEGFNETFSKQPKSFKVKGTLKNNNYISESMSYNYTVKSLNEGKTEKTKVVGRVRTNK